MIRLNGHGNLNPDLSALEGFDEAGRTPRWKEWTGKTSTMCSQTYYHCPDCDRGWRTPADASSCCAFTRNEVAMKVWKNEWARDRRRRSRLERESRPSSDS